MLLRNLHSRGEDNQQTKYIDDLMIHDKREQRQGREAGSCQI